MPYNPHDDKFTEATGAVTLHQTGMTLQLLTSAKQEIKWRFDRYVVEDCEALPINQFVLLVKSAPDVLAYIKASNNSVTAHWIIHRYICELLQSYICGKTFVPSDAKEC